MKTSAALAPASIRPWARRRASRMLTAIVASAALVLTPVIATPAMADDEPTAVVAPASASIAGSLVVGENVSVQADGWVPADAELSYVWWHSPEPYQAPVDGVDQNDEGVVIDGATGSQLALDASLAGRFVWAVVTGSAPALTSSSIVAAATAPVELPVLAGVPDVSITGTAVVGAPLAATLSAPLPDGVGVTYQWRRAGMAIDGAADSGYTPVAADALTTLDVVATYTADGYTPVTRSSAGVVVAKANFTGAPTAKISGTVRLDSPVTAVTGSWPEGTTFSFSWRFTDSKNVETVSSTKTQVYTPTSNVVGRKLSVVITGTVPGHNPVSQRSASVVIAPGAFTSAPTPTITGSAAVGSTLKATAGKWAPTATVSYQWKRNGVSISKATASSYKLTSTDYGKKITVTVTAKRAGYTTATRTSAATLTVTKPFTKATTPTISGTARAGLTLTANPGTWSPTPTYTYQWMRNGVAVAGKTAKTYTLTSVDVGAKISVKVTYKRSGFFTRTVSSPATATVTAATTMTRDGGFKIGVHVAPGTYYAPGGNDCWFERRSNDDYGYADGVLGYSYRWEYGFGGQKVVTIKASDKYFYTEGCGTWRPVTSAPRTSVGDGTFVVGTQMKVGVWQVVGPFDSDGCYVEVLGSFSGNPTVDLIGGDYEGYVPEAGFAFRIESWMKGFTSDGCGTWKRVGN